ncbi:MAG: SDR family oxidoreductase [Clostridia bacterium]|nr:SDR family oxidoreductase [Clostridia bacterium]
MKIIVTGSSGGNGTAVAKRFISLGHTVYGIDILKQSFTDDNYFHCQCDIRNPEELPDIDGVGIIFNNAGTQNGDDIGVNLKGAINVTEKFIADKSELRSVLFNASASAVSGQEFPEYCASKSGLIGYMKNTAIRLAPYGVTCNAISLGGVLTSLNDPVVNDKDCWERIMKVTPFKKWMTPEEVADWVVFLTLTNRSMSGENLLIDNGEKNLNPTFVWPENDRGRLL